MRRLCVFCGSNAGHDPHYRAAAEQLGALLAERGIELVYGGGNVGLMGAVADACLAADIEALPFATQRFDAWWSSLSVQWCDPARVFAEAARVLRPQGRLAVSTLGPATFHELRSAFSTVDRYRHTLPFSAPAAAATSSICAISPLQRSTISQPATNARRVFSA